MKIRTIGTTLFIIGAILIMTIPTPTNPENNTNTLNTTTKATQTITINETELHQEFNRIASLPYTQYKCREKSDLLLQYIHTHDPHSPVHTRSIQHKTGKYSHVYVEYQGTVFDPTCTPALYRVPIDKYNGQLDDWGFNRDHIMSTGYAGT